MIIDNREKRRFHRFHLQFPASINHLATPDDRGLKGEVFDLSLGGLRVRLNNADDLLPGSDIDVALEPLIAGEPIRASGRVKWLETTADAFWDWEAGIELTGMSGATWDRWFNLMPWH